MVVKKGYKQTDIGLIPYDWHAVSVEECVSRFQLGGNYANSQAQSQFPLIKMGNLGRGKVNVEKLEYVQSTVDERHRLAYGDVLFNTRNTLELVGKVAIWRDELPRAYYNSNIMRFEFSDRLVSSNEYMNAAMNTKAFVTALSNIATGTTSVAAIYTKDLLQLRLAIPPKQEQQAIASALSDIDELIRSLEKLIAKKKNIKQGAMQELLTGKKRLPGFGDEWVEKSMEELFIFTGGLSASREQLSTNGCCYLHYGDIHSSTKTCIDVEDDYYSIPKLDIPIGKVSSSALLSDGDVVFVDASEDDEGASKHVVVRNKTNIPFISGLHTIVAKSKSAEIVHSYREYCFQTESIRSQFKYYAAGTKVTGISKGNIAKIKLHFPLDVEEQLAIAAVLSDMESEIEALERKLAKYKDIKQGMMQELLTGRIRLVETAVKKQAHTKEFDEAVVISALVAAFGNTQHPMTAFQRQKYTYFLHRYWSGQAEGYGKFAAGPYNPNIKYRGPESIALKKKYVKEHIGGYKGFIAGEHSQEASDYFKEWYGEEPLKWLEQFRYQKKDELELLATVDMAITDLQKARKSITAAAVKAIIKNSSAWKNKLTRPVFSDANIARAIAWSNEHFGNV